MSPVYKPVYKWQSALPQSVTLYVEYSLQNSTLRRAARLVGRRVLMEEGLARSSKKQNTEKTDKWDLGRPVN